MWNLTPAKIGGGRMRVECECGKMWQLIDILAEIDEEEELLQAE